MYRKLATFTVVLAIIALCAVPFSVSADPGKPFFGAAIWVDYEAYGSKATTMLPAPNGHNIQSYDPLYHVLAGDDLTVLSAVAESAPGDRDYNGGRWMVIDVRWNDPADAEPLYSYQEIVDAVTSGAAYTVDLETYVQCPLLPTK
jgi:hypothetical protein